MCPGSSKGKIRPSAGGSDKCQNLSTTRRPTKAFHPNQLVPTSSFVAAPCGATLHCLFQASHGKSDQYNRIRDKLHELCEKAGLGNARIEPRDCLSVCAVRPDLSVCFDSGVHTVDVSCTAPCTPVACRSCGPSRPQRCLGLRTNEDYAIWSHGGGRRRSILALCFRDARRPG